MRNIIGKGKVFSGKGSALQLFVTCMSGIFNVILFSFFVFVYDYYYERELLSQIIGKYKSLFEGAVATYVFFVAICFSVGMSSYLLSYIFVGMASNFMEKFIYNFKSWKSKEKRIIDLCQNIISGIDFSIRERRYLMYFYLSNEENSSGLNLDIKFLFTQIMFARTAMFSFFAVIVCFMFFCQS